jgi:hypothetical protein
LLKAEDQVTASRVTGQHSKKQKNIRLEAAQFLSYKIPVRGTRLTRVGDRRARIAGKTQWNGHLWEAHRMKLVQIFWPSGEVFEANSKTAVIITPCS